MSYAPINIEIRPLVIGKDERPVEEFLNVFHQIGKNIIPDYLDLHSLAKLSASCRYFYTLEKTKKWKEKAFEDEARKLMIGTGLVNAWIDKKHYGPDCFITDIDFENRHIECRKSDMLGGKRTKYIFPIHHSLINGTKEEDATSEIPISNDFYVCGYCGLPYNDEKKLHGNNICSGVNKSGLRVKVHDHNRMAFDENFTNGIHSLDAVRTHQKHMDHWHKLNMFARIKKALFYPQSALRYEFNIPIVLIGKFQFNGLPLKWIGMDEIIDHNFYALNGLKDFQELKKITNWEGEPENIDIVKIIEARDRLDRYRLVKNNKKREKDEEEGESNAKPAKVQKKCHIV